MNPPDPTDQSTWHLENWQLPGSWATCERCGILILKSHLADGVCRDVTACDARQALADPVAAVRLEDGSQVVAYAPVGLEVRAFGADDLDARGLPRWKP